MTDVVLSRPCKRQRFLRPKGPKFLSPAQRAGFTEELRAFGAEDAAQWATIPQPSPSGWVQNPKISAA
jgi:hypothetical protein